MLLDRIKVFAKENYGSESVKDFEQLRLRKIEVEKPRKKVTYTISSPISLSDAKKNELKNILKEFSPDGFKIFIDITIDKMDTEIAYRMFWEFLKESCPSVYLELFDAKDQVKVEDKSGKLSFVFNVTKKVKELLTSGALLKIEKFFNSFTCYPITYFINEISSEEVDVESTLLHLDKERERTVDAYLSQPERKIILEDKRNLIGKLPSISPQYIIDVVSTNDRVVVCGKFANLNQREAKNKNMTICKFTLQDFSGTINVVYFAKNEKDLASLLSIYSGDEVVVSGRAQVNSYDGKLELLASSIAICKIADQQYKLNEFKPVPPEYVKVSPMPFETNTQTDVFKNEEDIPNALKGKCYVIFDLETTGLQCQVDKIIEIGAVKLINGQIVETFTTLINPQTPIPHRITELNNITDDMVRDKPIFAEVCGDFYKFTHGATLVAHNISFDHTFLEYYARPCGYLFNNILLDTWLMSKKYFEKQPSKSRPKDEKLETLAKYFNFELGDFHRAMYDSLVATKLFVKLLTMDETLLDKI